MILNRDSVCKELSLLRAYSDLCHISFSFWSNPKNSKFSLDDMFFSCVNPWRMLGVEEGEGVILAVHDSGFVGRVDYLELRKNRMSSWLEVVCDQKPDVYFFSAPTETGFFITSSRSEVAEFTSRSSWQETRR